MEKQINPGKVTDVVGVYVGWVGRRQEPRGVRKCLYDLHEVRSLFIEISRKGPGEIVIFFLPC